MKAYVTKYALTQGILEVEGHISKFYTEMFEPHCKHYLNVLHGEGREWHRTLEGAIARSEEMRDRKVESLTKQIAKLEKMTFDKAKPWL